MGFLGLPRVDLFRGNRDGGFSTRECDEKQSRDEFLTVVNILEAFIRNTPPQSTHSCHSATHWLGVSGQLCKHHLQDRFVWWWPLH